MDDDLKNGMHFLNLVDSALRADVAEGRATLYALLEELAARGVIDLASLEARREQARVLESERQEKLPRPFLGPPGNKYALKVLPDIDCQALIPICQGRCCRLVFALSPQDIDEGVVKWELGRPYLIRQESGRCVHQDGETKLCTVREQRPAICRSYDCRDDKRIWSDFEKRILAD